MNIVWFGQQNWDVCWTEKQQLCTRLARRGHRILYVDSHWVFDVRTLGQAVRAAAPATTGFGLREEAPGLSVFTYHYAPPLGRKVNAHKRWLAIRAIARRMMMTSPVALAMRPDAGWAMDAVRPAVRAYYAVDEWTGFGGLTAAQAAAFRAQEEALLRRTDLALGVSQALAERFRQIQPRTYVLTNGVDAAQFAPERLSAAPPHPAIAPLPRPRLGFVGQVDERLDQAMLAAVARARPHWQVVLVGRVKEGVDVSALAAVPNVHFTGFVERDGLPGVLRELDVGLVPYRSTALTQSCNPAKVYEYLAAGLPVVSTPLAGLAECGDVVRLASTADATIAAVEACLSDDPAGRVARQAVARRNSWDQRADALEARLAEAAESAAAGRDRTDAARPWPRRTVRGGRASDRHVHLDAKDESVRQLKDRFAASRPTVRERLAFSATTAAGWAYYALRVAGRTVTGRTPAAVRKIMVVRLGYLGDLVVLLPALDALRRRYPHARIVLGVQPGMPSAALLARSPAVDEIRTLDFLSRPGRLAKLRGAAGLFAQGFDLVVSGVSYFLLREPFFAGAPFRLGLYDGHPLQRLNGRVVPLDASRHEADNNLALVEAVGGRAVGAQRAPALTMDEVAVRAAGIDLADRLGIPADAEVVAVHAGSARPSRRWPADRFAAMAGRLLAERPDRWVVLTGTPKEAPLVEDVRARIPAGLRARAPSGIGLTDLNGLVALLDRSAAVVSNDTGVMHLARARGRPLLALLGPENHRRWGPHPVGPGPAVALRYAVPCAPCSRWECDGLYCMRLIAVDEVMGALRPWLRPATNGSEDVGVWADGRPAGGHESPLVPLAIRLQTRSWGELSAAGMSLPLVSVVIDPVAPGDAGDGPPVGRGRHDGVAAPGGGGGGGDRAADLSRVEPALRRLARQAYPSVEVVVVTPTPAGADLLAAWRSVGLTVRAVCRPSDTPLREAVRATSGEFVAVTHDADWPPERLDEDVANLIREPNARAVRQGRIFVASATPQLTELGRSTFRRSVLLKMLDEACSATAAVRTRPRHEPSALPRAGLESPEVPLGAAMLSAGPVVVDAVSNVDAPLKTHPDRGGSPGNLVGATYRVPGHGV